MGRIILISFIELTVVKKEKLRKDGNVKKILTCCLLAMKYVETDIDIILNAMMEIRYQGMGKIYFHAILFSCSDTCEIEEGWKLLITTGREAYDYSLGYNIGSKLSAVNDIMLPIYGDQLIVGPEECDDGNTDPVDGCVKLKSKFCFNQL